MATIANVGWLQGLKTRRSRRRAGEHSDLDWLVPMIAVTITEMGLWWAAWQMGFASEPMFRTYSIFGWTSLTACVLGLFLFQVLRMMRRGEKRPLARSSKWLRENHPRLLIAIVAMQISAVGAAAFSALKTAMPTVTPFWLDPFLASAEKRVFGMHPWEMSHHVFGWATRAIDLVYSAWIFIMFFSFCMVLVLKPSPLKTRALLSYAFAWLILGLGGAYLLSSAGPIFYDRVVGGGVFAALDAALGDAPTTVRAANMLWNSYDLDKNAVGSGISAMPSLHVAIALWIALILQGTRIAFLGWLYFGLICLGSVHLGWHYASDGLIGAVGFYLIWRASGVFVHGAEIKSISTLRNWGFPKRGVTSSEL